MRVMATPEKLVNVLFLDKDNWALSILAEALVNGLPITRGKFRAYSAGAKPSHAISSIAADLLRRDQLFTDKLAPKSWDAFAKPDAPQMDFVIGLADTNAAKQAPQW